MRQSGHRSGNVGATGADVSVAATRCRNAKTRKLFRYTYPGTAIHFLFFPIGNFYFTRRYRYCQGQGSRVNDG